MHNGETKPMPLLRLMMHSQVSIRQQLCHINTQYLSMWMKCLKICRLTVFKWFVGELSCLETVVLFRLISFDSGSF